MNTLEPHQPEEVDLTLLYKRIQQLKVNELFHEPYDPPEDLTDV